jgi:hypothetical protein
MHKKFRPNRTEGQPVGEMNSPQGEDRAALVEKGPRLRLLGPRVGAASVIGGIIADWPIA